MHLVIRNEEDLSAAMERAEALVGCTPDSDEERELAEIADAIQVYEDSLEMMRGVAKRAADEPERDVPCGSGFE